MKQYDIYTTSIIQAPLDLQIQYANYFSIITSDSKFRRLWARYLDYLLSQKEAAHVQDSLAISTKDSIKKAYYLHTADSIRKRVQLPKITNLIQNNLQVPNTKDNYSVDTVQFNKASYELEKLLKQLDKAYYPVSYLSDSSTLVNAIINTIKFFNAGQKNYCVKNSSFLSEGFTISIDHLNSIKNEVIQGYPDVNELRRIGYNVMSSNLWAGVATSVKDDVQTQDQILNAIKKAIAALRINYNDPLYQASFSMYR